MAHRNREGRENTFEKIKTYLWLILPILLVFVSITSFIAGMNLNSTKQPMGRIMDTIILSPDQKLQSIDVSGNVTYSDGTPYANGLLELHSTPVQTKTDEEGRFTFSQVVLGSHTLYLLDEGGEVVSSLAFYVERNPEEKAGSVGEEGESYRVEVSMDTEALFLNVQISPDQKIKIDQEVLALSSDGVVKNQYGEIVGTAVDFSKGIIESQIPVPSGENRIEPETDSVGVLPEATSPGIQESEQLPTGETNALPESEASNEGIIGETKQTETAETSKEDWSGSDSEDSGSSNTKPTKPSASETTPEETKPAVPEPTPEEPTPSVPETTPEETTPEPTEEMEHITVSDDKNQAWAQNTTIDLFANRTGIGPDRKLAPGSEGSYQFQVANGNAFDVHYTITMEKGANQNYLIPLRYRLKSGNEYIGGISTWLTAEQLKDSQVALGTEETCRYTLEWQWPYEGGNDKLDTMIGMSENLEYELVVKIRITQS